MKILVIITLRERLSAIIEILKLGLEYGGGIKFIILVIMHVYQFLPIFYPRY